MRRKWILNKPVKGIKLNPGHPLSRGLVGCWLFNEGHGDKVFDLSGNGNTGTLQGSTFWGVGQFGSVLSFGGNTGGTSDYVALDTIPQLTFNSGDEFTVIVSFIVIDDTDWHSVFMKSLRNGFYDHEGIAIGPNAAGTSTAIKVGTEQLIITADFNSHHQVATTFNSSAKLTAYLDGVYDGDLTVADDLSGGNARNAIIGGSTPEGWLRGDVDYLFVFNRALSASEINQLYREPFCMFERQEIVFLAVAVGPANLLSVNAVTTANIKSINAVLIGNVKSINAIA